MPSIEVIINAAGGSFVEGETEQKLREAFAASGLDATVRLAKTGEQIGEFADAAVKSDAEIVVGGGGDGTISFVASKVASSGKTFGVLPLGTLNNFSKDLQIPPELEAAVALIAGGYTTEVDLGEVNGRPFVNNSSIGIYPHIVKNREQQQEQLGYGKWRAAFLASLRMFRVIRLLRVGINVDGRFFLRKTPFVFVGNNRYEMDSLNIGRRLQLGDGKLSVYFLHRGGRIGIIALLVRTILGRVKQWRDFEEVLTDSVSIQTKRKRLYVAIDGEVVTLETPLNYKIRPKALKVIVPRPQEEAESDA